MPRLLIIFLLSSMLVVPAMGDSRPVDSDHSATLFRMSNTDVLVLLDGTGHFHFSADWSHGIRVSAHGVPLGTLYNVKPVDWLTKSIAEAEKLAIIELVSGSDQLSANLSSPVALRLWNDGATNKPHDSIEFWYKHHWRKRTLAFLANSRESQPTGPVIVDPLPGPSVLYFDDNLSAMTIFRKRVDLLGQFISYDLLDESPTLKPDVDTDVDEPDSEEDLDGF